LAANTGRAGAALESRVAEAVDDARLIDQDTLTDLEKSATRSLVTVPICVPGRVDRPAVGVLQLRDKRGDEPFTAGDLKLAQAILVAAVSGHTLASALMQTAARGALRAVAPRGASPGEILRRASIALHDDLSQAELFITVWFGRVDSVTGTLVYSDAGHNPA